MTPHFFFLISLLPVVLATLPSLSLRQDPDRDCASSSDPCATTVFLKDGFAIKSVNSFFGLTSRLGASSPTFEIGEGDHDDIITRVEFGQPPPPLPDSENIVYPTTVTFKGFPGRTMLRVSITDGEGTRHNRTHIFQVIGIVLYEKQGNESRILTGKNPSHIIVRDLGGGVFGTTVQVAHFKGNVVTTPVGLENLRLIVDKQHRDVLPWDYDKCPIAGNISRLNARCAMAFSVDFANFSVRIPAGKQIPSAIRVQLEWVGIQDYQKRNFLDSGVTSTGEEVVLTNDIFTSTLIEKETVSDDLTSSSLAGWKIGVIAASCVIFVIGTFTIMCCYLRRRKRALKKPEPDVAGMKDRFFGFSRPVARLQQGEDELGDDGECCVEEPPSPNGSEVLMLENESHGAITRRSGDDHIEGLVSLERLKEDKSVEKLVLPPGVVRGIDLESSTEGTSGFEYGSASGEKEIIGYSHGKSSLTRDQFVKSREYGSSQEKPSIGSKRSAVERPRDSDYLQDLQDRMKSLQRDREHIRELQRELERDRSTQEGPEARMRPQSSVEELPESDPTLDYGTSDVTSRSRDGVGAAINRIRQLDLLKGPASRGLVGRNGEPIRNSGGDDEIDGEFADLPGSALS